eukprot:SM000019S05030  [mRNA]  locus=s19:514785:519016:- [translate_table: standard]
MGISGLLPIFKSISTPTHVREYAGKKAAVDTYSWLHKGAFGCSDALCKGQPTDRYVDYCMQRVDLLLHSGVTPVMVFDGGLLPAKAEQEARRQKSRKEHLDRARDHELAGNTAAAFVCYQKAVDITPDIAHNLIKVLKQRGIKFIVAPYEADAQLAYLALQGLVEVVITEDSDLLAYGCPKVLFKMDKTGQGLEIQYSQIVRASELNFTNFTHQMFLETCILSGCDYLSSLQGMGVKRAHGLMRRFKSYDKVIRSLRFNGVTVPDDYEANFVRAIVTFRHQRVYDPRSQAAVHLHPVDQLSSADLSGTGSYPSHPSHTPLQPELAKAIAEADVNPITHAPIQEVVFPKGHPTESGRSNPAQTSKRTLLSLPVQKSKLSKYFVSVSRAAKEIFRPPRTSVAETRETVSSLQNLNAFTSLDTDSPSIVKSPVIKTGKLHSASTRHPQSPLEDFDAFLWRSPTMEDPSELLDASPIDETPPTDSQDCEDEIAPCLDRGHKGEDFNIAHTLEDLEFFCAANEPVERQNTVHYKDYPLSSSLLNKRVAAPMPETTLPRPKRPTTATACHKRDSAQVPTTLAAGDFERVDQVQADRTFVLDEEPTQSGESSNGLEVDEICLKQHAYTPSVGIKGNLSDKVIPPSASDNVAQIEDQGKSKGANFACDIAHVQSYRQVAHRTMSSFVDKILAFKHASSGSRPGNLRPPGPSRRGLAVPNSR